MNLLESLESGPEDTPRYLDPVAPATVLVVDDDPLTQELLAEFLREIPGVRVEIFAAGTVALDWCRQHEPDLVITDVQMPDIDGISLIVELGRLEHMRGVPLVVVTAEKNPEVRYQALDAGASDYLTKPLNAREVQARAKSMLAVRDAHRSLHQKSEWLSGQVKAATRTLHDQEEEVILSLSKALEQRESETGRHIVRIAHYSERIAAGLGLGENHQRTLFLTAPMHDIGKIAIPDHILLKPARLTDSEFAMMKRHTLIGHEILSPCTSTLMRVAADIALNHHERWDGTGYPNGISGEAISYPSRIVSAADVLDALLASRPYKAGWEWSAAIDHIVDGAGTQFAPDVSEAVSAAADDLFAIYTELAD
ncbi:MAG: HD domain-containing phosphohydrolase [Longimicrobiales bacterium]